MEDTNTTGLDKIAAALAAAQSKFKNPEKNRTVKVQHKAGGSHTYSYATLDEVLDCTRGPLSANGLAFVQLVMLIEGNISVLETKLIHASGQSIESIYKLPEGLGVQEMGAAITYARRYAACAMLGIAGETDTDAEDVANAEQSLEEAKKAALVEQMKGKGFKKAVEEGRVTPATTAPAPEDKKPEPEPEPEKKPEGKRMEPKPDKKAKKEESKEDDIPMDFVDAKLQAKLTESGITVAQFKAWGVGKGNIPADMDMSKLEAGFIAAVIKNWDKVVSAIKK